MAGPTRGKGRWKDASERGRNVTWSRYEQIAAEARELVAPGARAGQVAAGVQ